MRELLWWMRARYAGSGAAAFSPMPLLDSVTPATGPQAGGTLLTLTGNLLDSATRVLVGGLDCSGVVRQGSRQCQAVTPAGAGVSDVTVATMGGQSTKVGAFTYASAAVDAVQFSGSQSFYSAAAAGTTLGTARVRFRLDTLPASGAFQIIAGPNNGGGSDGWLVCLEDTYTGATVCQLTVYAGISGALTRIARKFLMPADVGRIFTIHITCDGSKALVYLDGKKLNEGVSAASITASTSIMNLGARSGGTFSSQVTLLDVAEGSTALTPAQVATDAALSTPSYAGQTHRYVASAGITTTWLDQVGSAHLSRFGTPGPVSFAPTYGQHRGAVEIWGDSIAEGRKSGGGSGDGWRRAVQRYVSATAGEAITFVGFGFPSLPDTFDYDYKNSCTGGESLTTRLGTLAADLALYAPADAATLLAYGINDIVALSRTAAQLRNDITTACGLIASARPGRPIFVCSVMDVATAVSTAPQRAEIDAFQAAFAGFITTLQGTYPTVVGIDTAPAVTNANDAAQLYDGTHPTPATYAAMANIIGPAIAAAM